MPPPKEVGPCHFPQWSESLTGIRRIREQLAERVPIAFLQLGARGQPTGQKIASKKKLCSDVPVRSMPQLTPGLSPGALFGTIVIRKRHNEMDRHSLFS